MSERTLLTIPYKGLVPYDEADASFFFGREAEQEIITANLIASRITLLYGPSGVGKSSVLRAGVAYDLRRLAEQNISEHGAPEFAVVVFSGWRDDPITEFTDKVREEVSAFLDGHQIKKTEKGGKGSLDKNLQFWSEQINGDLLIILDQFEEFFLYHSQEDGEGTFAREFPRAINRPDLRANFLISVREDALAKLDHFKGRIPNLFENYLRIDHLDRTAARAAIEKPISEYNRLRTDGVAVSVEPDLVRAVLDQVKTGHMMLGAAGRGVVERADGARIEAPYLQLVMTRLWHEEIQTSSGSTLRLSTLQRLGGAEQIVRTHLDTTMSSLPPKERDAAAQIFHYLVTPSGMKIAHKVTDLAEYVQIPPSRLDPVLEKLSSASIRILRPVSPPIDQPGSPRYEIFHDVLAGAILDWRARYVQAQELAEAEQRRIESEKQLAEKRRQVNKLRWGVICLSVLLMLVIGLAFFAFQQRAAAKRAQIETEAQRQVAVARELSAAALNNLDVDPERSILLGLQAASVSSMGGKPILREAEEALHRAVQTSRVRLTLRGHTLAQYGVTFSPDGRYLATASADKTGRVWDAVTGKEIFTLAGHTGPVNDIAFSPDGTSLATASDDNTAKVWDRAAGKELLTLTGHAGALKGIAFSPDGKRLATCSSDRTAKVWDSATGNELFTMSGHTDVVNRVTFSPDGRYLATVSDDKTAKMWDAETGKVVLTQRGTSLVWGLAFSPDGKRVAFANFDGRSTIVDIASRRLLSTLSYRAASHNAVAFNPAGTHLVIGQGDGTAKVWDAATGQVLLTLYGHTGPAWDVAFSPDGARVATASWDGTTRVWDVSPAGGKEWATLTGHRGMVWDIAWSPNGRRLATVGADKTAKIWDAATGQVLLNMAGHKDAVNGVAFSPDGTRLATLSDDQTTKVWDTATGEAFLTLSTPVTVRGIIHHGVAFSPDGKRLATVSDDKIVKLWDVSTGKELLALSGHTGRLFCLAFSPDGTRLATGSADQTARVWDAATGQELFTLVGHTVNVYGVAFSPDGARLATASGDGKAKVWDMTTRQELLSLSGHRGIVFSVSFSPDGTRLATSGYDSTVKVWDLSAAEGRIEEPLTLSGHRSAIFRVLFNQDGRRLATTSRDGTSRVFALAVEDILAIAKSRVTRTLTTSECQKFLHVAQCPSEQR